MGLASLMALHFTVYTEMPSAPVHQPDLALANCSGFACEPWSPSLLVKPASLLSLHHRSLFRPEALCTGPPVWNALHPPAPG